MSSYWKSILLQFLKNSFLSKTRRFFKRYHYIIFPRRNTNSVLCDQLLCTFKKFEQLQIRKSSEFIFSIELWIENLYFILCLRVSDNHSLDVIAESQIYRRKTYFFRKPEKWKARPLKNGLSDGWKKTGAWSWPWSDFRLPSSLTPSWG